MFSQEGAYLSNMELYPRFQAPFNDQFQGATLRQARMAK